MNEHARWIWPFSRSLRSLPYFLNLLTNAFQRDSSNILSADQLDRQIARRIVIDNLVELTKHFFQNYRLLFESLDVLNGFHQFNRLDKQLVSLIGIVRKVAPALNRSAPTTVSVAAMRRMVNITHPAYRFDDFYKGEES